MNGYLSALESRPAVPFLSISVMETKELRHRRQKREWARQDRQRKKTDLKKLKKDIEVKKKSKEAFQGDVDCLFQYIKTCCAILEQHKCSLKVLPPLPSPPPQTSKATPTIPCATTGNQQGKDTTGNGSKNRDKSSARRSARSSVTVAKEEEPRTRKARGDDSCCWLNNPLPFFTFSDFEAAASYLLQIPATSAPSACELKTSSSTAGKPQAIAAANYEPKSGVAVTNAPNPTTCFEPKPNTLMIYGPSKADTGVLYHAEIDTFEPKTNAADSFEPKPTARMDYEPMATIANSVEPATVAASSVDSKPTYAMSHEPLTAFAKSFDPRTTTDISPLTMTGSPNAMTYQRSFDPRTTTDISPLTMTGSPNAMTYQRSFDPRTTTDISPLTMTGSRNAMTYQRSFDPRTTTDISPLTMTGSPNAMTYQRSFDPRTTTDISPLTMTGSSNAMTYQPHVSSTFPDGPKNDWSGDGSAMTCQPNALAFTERYAWQPSALTSQQLPPCQTSSCFPENFTCRSPIDEFPYSIQDMMSLYGVNEAITS